MQGDKALLQREVEGKETSVTTKHKWEEECPGRELFKKKKKETNQNRTKRHIRIIITT